MRYGEPDSYCCPFSIFPRLTNPPSQPPVAVCKSATVSLSTDGTGSIVPPDIDNGSADACGIASLSLDSSTFDCSHVGANTVTLAVADVNGNIDSCHVDVHVEDNQVNAFEMSMH